MGLTVEQAVDQLEGRAGEYERLAMASSVSGMGSTAAHYVAKAETYQEAVGIVRQIDAGVPAAPVGVDLAGLGWSIRAPVEDRLWPWPRLNVGGAPMDDGVGLALLTRDCWSLCASFDGAVWRVYEPARPVTLFDDQPSQVWRYQS